MNPAVYSEKFLDENDEPTCTLKIIPPGWMYHYGSIALCTDRDRLKIIFESLRITQFLHQLNIN